MALDMFEMRLCAGLEVEPDGTVRRVSKGWQTVLGWSGDGMVGESLQGQCIAEHAHRFQKALDTLD